jgi:hypothetical protein
MPSRLLPHAAIAALLAASLLGAVTAQAQQAKPVAPAVAESLPSDEPAVRRNVIEDDNARVDELRVRGAVRSITVTPKGPIKTPYEVLPTDASRDPSDGPGTTKGAQGRRVWRVLTF